MNSDGIMWGNMPVGIRNRLKEKEHLDYNIIMLLSKHVDFIYFLC